MLTTSHTMRASLLILSFTAACFSGQLLAEDSSSLDQVNKTDQIKELDSAGAKVLVTKYRGKSLRLNGLSTVSAEVAKTLATHGDGLSLNGIAALQDNAAEALAACSGYLSLE